MDSTPDGRAAGSAEPPPLPGPLADPRPVMVAGSLGWAVAAVATGLGGGGEPFVTCLVGLAAGGLGYGVFFLQRRQVRRGGRGQRGLDR